MSDQKIVVTITPESDESCRGCVLLKGINFAQCLAGFVPRFDQLQTLRPPECVDAVKTTELISIHLAPGANIHKERKDA